MADTKEPETPNATFLHREDSPTAASGHNRLYRGSGVQTYRVMVATGMGMIPNDVEAASGDEAAELTLAKYIGGKVAHVAPAPQKAA